MSGVSGEAGLGSIADFIVSNGLHKSGYTYINTDEGWENKNRDENGKLQWKSSAYPSGLPTFIKKLNSMGLKYGIYGAASGVTCGENPGQLYYEDIDAQTYAEWGVEFLKSDNCASYALDSSVRFGAMRDALNRTGKSILLSIEPFSINPDPEQSIKVSNMWRTGCDVSGRYSSFMDRADISDKWSPLAGPGGWNDPDMINVQNPGGHLTLNENRLYFGLWAIMKSPLLLSSNLPKLSAEIIEIINNTEVIAINQDKLGVQARKLSIDGKPLPWLVGVTSCDYAPSKFYNRGFEKYEITDTRAWATKPTPDNPKEYTIQSLSTKRCLAADLMKSDHLSAVVLLPCNNTSPSQRWIFDKGINTVTSITNVAIDQALAISNSSLFSKIHIKDKYSVTDTSYGENGLVFIPPYDQSECTHRDCQNYDPSQMWYFSPTEGLLRHSTYTASINHHDIGDGYVLTNKVPTWRHGCLSHVLSTRNFGTITGTVEVWGGPLSDNSFVIGLVNRGMKATTIEANWEMFEMKGITKDSSFVVTNLWNNTSLGKKTGGFSAQVGSHDIEIFKLYPAK